MRRAIVPARSWSLVLPLVLGFGAASCTQPPKPAPLARATAPAIPNIVHAAPAPLVVPAPEAPVDPRMIVTAQQNLHLLGYGNGKANGMLDAATRKAITDFQKDQALPQDGRLTAALAEKLRSLRAGLSKDLQPASTDAQVFVYSDGLVRDRPANALAPSTTILTDDAAPNFLQTLKPGAQGVYHLGRRGKDGSFSVAATVTCHAGHLAPVNVPAGLFDAIAADCEAAGTQPLQFHWYYAPKLGQAVRLLATPAAGYARDLVAIRPSTAGWPSAARTGLDWALTSTLEAPSSAAPVQWSSTGVAQHFEIRAYATLLPSEAGLVGDSGAFCRRFELVRTDGPARHYPGIACKDAKGVWALPGSHTKLASPAAGLSGPSQIENDRQG